MDDFKVMAGYSGYTYVGHAQGRYEAGERTVVIDGVEVTVPVKQPYYNMYVLTPVSGYISDDYRGSGLKAEKLKCVSALPFKDLKPGDRVLLFFDDKKRVMHSELDVGSYEVDASTGELLEADA